MMAKETKKSISNDYLRVGQAAEFIGVTKSYMYRLIRERRIPHFKSQGGKLVYFLKADLEAWMAGTYVAPQSEIEVMTEKRALTETWT